MKLTNLFLLLCMLFSNIMFAQQECDCPDPAEGDEVCVEYTWEDGTVETFPFPSACWAECEGLTVVDGECGWDEEWPEDDCDCPEPTEGDEVCAETVCGDHIIVMPYPSACLAECYGAVVVDGECDDWEDEWPEEEWPEDDCDCPEPGDDDEVCVEFEWDGEAEVFPYPSACYAECDGLTVVDGECEWDEEEWPEECDCPEPTEGDEVCVEFEWDGEVEVYPYPSACWAECDGLTVVDGECEWEEEEEWPEDCDCPDPTEGDEVCVEYEWEDGEVEVFPYPSACWAECDGLTVVDGECGWDEEWPEDCDCPDPTEGDEVCVEYEWEDGTVEVFPYPSACWAECDGLTVVDGECEWDDEEWPEDDEWEDFPEDWDIDCFIENVENVTSFQEMLLNLHANCGLELSQCILDAPVFDTDDEFIEYILMECEGWFGLTTESSSVTPDENPYLRLYQNYGGDLSTTSNKELTELAALKIVTNPVREMLYIEASSVDIVSFEILNMKGQVVLQNSTVGQTNMHQIAVDGLNTGMYVLRATGKETAKSLKFIIVD